MLSNRGTFSSLSCFTFCRIKGKKSRDFLPAMEKKSRREKESVANLTKISIPFNFKFARLFEFLLFEARRV